MYYTALLGFATTVIPRWLTYYVSSALFAIFGLRMIREGLWHDLTITIHIVFAFYITHKHCMLCLGMKMSADEGQEEYEEVQADIRKKDEEVCSLQPNRKTIEYVSTVLIKTCLLLCGCSMMDRVRKMWRQALFAHPSEDCFTCSSLVSSFSP